MQHWDFAWMDKQEFSQMRLYRTQSGGEDFCELRRLSIQLPSRMQPPHQDYDNPWDVSLQSLYCLKEHLCRLFQSLLAQLCCFHWNCQWPVGFHARKIFLTGRRKFCIHLHLKCQKVQLSTSPEDIISYNQFAFLENNAMKGGG